jgi:hypothetical protein
VPWIFGFDVPSVLVEVKVDCFGSHDFVVIPLVSVFVVTAFLELSKVSFLLLFGFFFAKKVSLTEVVSYLENVF